MNALNKKRGLVGMTAILFLDLVACLLSACNDKWMYSSPIRSRWRPCLSPHVL